jgi:hypothetical protein
MVVVDAHICTEYSHRSWLDTSILKVCSGIIIIIALANDLKFLGIALIFPSYGTSTVMGDQPLLSKSISSNSYSMLLTNSSSIPYSSLEKEVEV